MKRYIAEGLEQYLLKNTVPWHMPGHKRKNFISDGVGGESERTLTLNIDNALDYVHSMDVTEVPGTDDLHNPEEMILASMKELARVYNTYASYYLVNGATCGIMAAISACYFNDRGEGRDNSDKLSGDIIIAGNCHKSVYNTVELLGIKVSYIKPRWKKDNHLPIQGSILPEDVERICRDNKSAKAIVITSPTYEGIVSDIKAISQIAHRYGIALIVDEAHGAHLPFAAKHDRDCDTALNKSVSFPVSAVSLGADIVVQSIHKTLTGLTQTAIIHVNNEGLDNMVRKYLSVYMTTSPSYVMLCSMERAISHATRADYVSFAARIADFRKKAGGLKNLILLENNQIQNLGGFAYDSSRIVFMSKAATGIYLQEALKRLGNIVVEMSGVNYVVLIATYMDDTEDFQHLYKTLVLLDKELEEESESANKKEDIQGEADNGEIIDYKALYALVGTVARDNVYAYPPGSYIVRAEEIITAEQIHKLIELHEAGIKLRGNLL